MPKLRSLLQRTMIWTKRIIDPLYAEGCRWYTQGTSTDRNTLEAMQLSRLRLLVAEHRRIGLCQDAAYSNYGKIESVTDLAALPVFSRQGITDLYPLMKEVHTERDDIATYTTGGSTGEPVKFMLSSRLRKLASGTRLLLDMTLGWQPGMPRVSLWRPSVLLGGNFTMQRPGLRGMLSDYIKYSFYRGGISPIEKDYVDFLRLVRLHPYCAVWGYASVLADCAEFMQAEGYLLPRGMIATAWNCGEMMFEKQKQLILDVFGVQPREFYSTRECSGIAAECSHGSLHVSPRYITEVVDPDTHATLPDGETGMLLFTDLFNDATPFIRYAVGDLGAIEWRECACGRRGMCLVKLDGRIAWLIRLKSGRKLSTGVFTAVSGFTAAPQAWAIVRLGVAEFEVRYVGKPLDDNSLRDFVTMLTRALEGSHVRVVRADELPRTPEGKVVYFVDQTTDATSP